MKKTLLLFLTVFFTGFISAQNLVDFTVDAGDDVTVDCVSGSCTDIEVEFTETYNPSADAAYNVVSLPFDPVPGESPTNLSVDDEFSEVIPLPFGFTFYGETYNEVVIGGNGNIVFNTALAEDYNAWAIDADELVPSPDLGNFDEPTAAIFGAFHDLNIADSNNGLTGTIQYSVTGEAPFRAFVVNYTDVAQFGGACDDYTTTQQIVLHETSNFVDVYITDKPLCTGWNDGYAVIGIQNAGGTLGISPPGRNTGQWEADMEAWRFIPVPNLDDATFEFNFVDEDGNPVLDENGEVITGNNATQVCFDEGVGQTYTAQVTYTTADGTSFTVDDQLEVIFEPQDLSGNLNDVQLCNGGTSTVLDATPYDGSLDPTELSFEWTDESGNIIGASATYTATATGNYTVDVTYGECTETFSSNVVISDGPDIELGADFSSCFPEPITLDATPSDVPADEATYIWFINSVEQTDVVGPTIQATAPGFYEVYVTAGGCQSSDIVHITSGGTFAVTFGAAVPICENANQSVELIPNIGFEDDGTLNYSWTFNGSEVGTQPTLQNVSQSGEYTLTVTNGVCTGVGTVEVTNECIPEGISPGNNDGLNDCMDLSFLADRGGIASLEIYNRYGTAVFKASNYVNQWCGQTDDGEDLTTGTYYYVIKFNGEDPVYGSVKTGWIYINREVN